MRGRLFLASLCGAVALQILGQPIALAQFSMGLVIHGGRLPFGPGTLPTLSGFSTPISGGSNIGQVQFPNAPSYLGGNLVNNGNGPLVSPTPAPAPAPLSMASIPQVPVPTTYDRPAASAANNATSPPMPPLIEKLSSRPSVLTMAGLSESPQEMGKGKELPNS